MSHSDYFAFPTFTPSFILPSLSCHDFSLCKRSLFLLGWSRGLNTWALQQGDKIKREKLSVSERGVYQGQTLQKPSHWPHFSGLFATMESTNLSTLLTPYQYKVCPWHWLEKTGCHLRHLPLPASFWKFKSEPSTHQTHSFYKLTASIFSETSPRTAWRSGHSQQPIFGAPDRRRTLLIISPQHQCFSWISMPFHM